MVKDRRGVHIEEGDWVIWLATGSYSEPDVYQVADVKKRVRLVDNTGWIDPYNVIVVDSIPYVEGRNNTIKKGPYIHEG